MEVGSEFLLLFSSSVLSMFTNPIYTEDQKANLQTLTLAVFAVLLLLNMSFVVYTLVTACKEKKRQKMLKQRREIYEEKYEEKLKNRKIAHQRIIDMKVSAVEEQKQL